MANPFMLAALEFEARGYSVIPLKSKDKTPLIPSWTEYQEVRADREQIGEWWRTWKTANLGIVTGAVSGIVVVDLDSESAKEEFKHLCPNHAGTAIAKTGKGWHVYFAHPGGKIPNRTGIKPGVDFRGDGGYVVAPPSVHANGNPYRWIRPLNGTPLQILPPNILDTPDTSLATGRYQERFDTAGTLAGLPEGQRDNGLFKLAAKLRGADVPYDVALELCEQAAANCIPPFLDTVRKVDQAYKYPAGHSGNGKSDQGNFWPVPLSAEAFLTRVAPGERWLWENAIPINSTSMIAGQPRTGKSTLALNIALAIARGAKFLNRWTEKSPACYISIDNSESEFRVICDRLNVVATDKIWIHTGKVPDNAVGWLVDQITKAEVKFVVIDTFQRFFSIKNMNDSQECIDKMSPLDLQIKDLGIHVMYLHHAGKGDPRTGDPTQTAALGSIAIKGMVPWYFQYSRVGTGQRILSSDFRGGKNFEGAYIEQDPKSGWSRLGGDLEDAFIADCIPKVLEFLDEEGSAKEADIRNAIDMRAVLISKTIRVLFKDDQISRSGTGKRGDAFQYSRSNSLKLDSGHESEKIVQLRDYIK